MLYTLDLKQQNDYWVKLQTLSTIQPYAYVQILRDMQLHPGPTDWVMVLPPWETRIPAHIQASEQHWRPQVTLP